MNKESACEILNISIYGINGYIKKNIKNYGK